MKSADWFLVGLRMLGAWMVLQAIWELINFTGAVSGMFVVRTTLPIAYLFHAAVNAIVAAVLLLCAPIFVGWFGWTIVAQGPHCAGCGYDLRGGQEKCPECGMVVIAPAPASKP